MFFQKRCELHVLNLVFIALCFERAVRNTGRSKKVTHAPFETSHLPIASKAPFGTLLFSGKRFERHVLNIVFPVATFRTTCSKRCVLLARFRTGRSKRCDGENEVQHVSFETFPENKRVSNGAFEAIRKAMRCFERGVRIFLTPPSVSNGAFET
jgi:hypothetical protein